MLTLLLALPSLPIRSDLAHRAAAAIIAITVIPHPSTAARSAQSV